MLRETHADSRAIACACPKATPHVSMCRSQLEDPWRLLPIQGLVDIGMKDMQA